MNFVFLSPHFPPNYYQFCVHLHHLGVNVLGIADEPYDQLHPELRAVLAEYYQVTDMHNYDELLRGLGYFTHRFGKLDRIDSQNEYWLETEARLRTDFNVFGLNDRTISHVKRKSLMKEMFAKAGVAHAAGAVVDSLTQARKLVKQIGYPVVAKPDIGVGAARTCKIHNDAELDRFFAQKPPTDYILEEFIQGTICTFDGLTDRDGHPVFYTSHRYSKGVMETVNEQSDIYYYSLREIPADLEEAGRRVLRAYDLRERFFHLEFFRTDGDGQIVALEVNMRPPGGMTTDMFNFANDIDIYHEWAHVVTHNRFTARYDRTYHCCYAGRKSNRTYAHSHAEILRGFSNQLVHHEAINGVFSAALGDYGYLFRSPSLEEIETIAAYILQPA
jgi:hypothetical protein